MNNSMGGGSASGAANPAAAGSTKSLISRSTMDISAHQVFKMQQEDLSWLTPKDFAVAFPYHLCFNKQLLIEHVGVAIKQR